MKRNIWLIDDDEIFAFILKHKIASDQFFNELEHFNSAEKALKVLNHPTSDYPFPDIIILDINMPRMSGWDFLKKIIHLKNKFKIYICSSSINSTDIELAKKHKVTKLNKPLQIKDIESIKNEFSI